MAVSPSGDITVIVANCKDKKDDFEITLDKAIDKTLNRYLFDPNVLVPDEKAEMIKSDKTVIATNVLNDTIPAFGVSVYTTIKD